MPYSTTLLQQFTYFSFVFAFFGMAGGSIYFFSQKSELKAPYRSAAAISGVICFIAAMTYFYMKDIYVSGVVDGKKTFPTEFRYIDWLLTVPLMLIKFPTLLGMGERGQQFMLKLIICALGMLITAFVAELNFDDKGIHYGFYGVSCAFWIYIIISLNNALRSLPSTITEAKRASIRRMFIFVLIGWVIYPLGFLAPTVGLEPEVRELVYNIGDLINKVGLGLVVVAGGFRDIKETKA